MFENSELKNHLETSSVVKLNSLVAAEWNINIPSNILQIGNYRYRPYDSSESSYNILPVTFDSKDSGGFYTGATDADISIDGGYANTNLPVIFKSKKEKNNILYSLEDCFKKFRPRSGINKAVSSGSTKGKYFHHSNMFMFDRPRYYLADRDDPFKYWTSFRTEDGKERGIANKTINGQYAIDDAAPFVVYKETVPANRLVVKMQTHIGGTDLGPFSEGGGSFSDPLYGDTNKRTPQKWKIQVLKNNSWVDVVLFGNNSRRRNGSPIIGSDGYVELEYGLIVPEEYRDIFVKAEELSSTVLLPEASVPGYAYLIRENEDDLGVYHIWVGDRYNIFAPNYGWYVAEESVNRLTNFVTDLTSPIKYTTTAEGAYAYREFDYINGVRIVVETMTRMDSTFDLIEISPRLAVDLSEKTQTFSITKTASDIGGSGMPVGDLLASVGDIDLFDFDQAFNSNNTNSIISKHLTKNIQFKFYEIIMDVGGLDYYVPIKTLYSEGFPETRSDDLKVSLKLRDMYFYLESITAPTMLLQNISLSYAVALLLDSVGFSNYSFKRLSSDKELIIPFFFIGPDKTVAEVLKDLATSSQTAMFFDEYNNFVMMSKEYILPARGSRETSLVLTGTNPADNSKLTNIKSISSQENKIYNDGKISYTTRYIQRTYGLLRQAMTVDNAVDAKSWIYKPVELWSISGADDKNSKQGEGANSTYSLSAIPLNTNLSSDIPYVSNNTIKNNVMDLGEGVFWLSRYSGYFYANGEVIKFDAVQHSVSGFGNVWITNALEYENYFSKLSFNGKIYPTGLVRIFAEPNYKVINGETRLLDGAVAKHGRGQFGTPVVSHTAGINSHWTNNDYVRGCQMQSSYLFTLNTQSSNATISALSLTETAAGLNNALAKQSTRNSIIKNFLAASTISETGVGKLQNTQSGTIQSSALVFNGPSFDATSNPVDHISYQYKPLDSKYKHFGTRMRIVGKIENSETRGQTPIGTNTYYVVTGTQPNQNINVSGGSGGLAFMLNPSTNVGYYFEIIALTENNLNQYQTGSEQDLDNVIFYKVYGDSAAKAVPVKLWGGIAQITVDDGKFTGQYRTVTEELPTVYDLAVEYQDIGKIRRFYLYINNNLIATVDDDKPLSVYNNIATFVRGSTRIMFENIYALSNNYALNTSFEIDTPVSSVFGDKEINVNESFRKYAMSGMIQSTYLSGISADQPPKHTLYFDEFGTIMREAAYLNIRYDKAYPALLAQIAPTFNKIKAYTVSGFTAGSYGAEFLLFNATDTVINLDETSGNFLRIQGVTFTESSENELTVDDYFDKTSNFSNPQFTSDNKILTSPISQKEMYEDIKISRLTFGKQDFSFDAPYIQTQDAAQDMLSWMIKKTMNPRNSVGVDIFPIPTLQLGDIVTIDHRDNEGTDFISSNSAQYVVYNIDYRRDADGPSMEIHLSEVENG